MHELMYFLCDSPEAALDEFDEWSECTCDENNWSAIVGIVPRVGSAVVATSEYVPEHRIGETWKIDDSDVFSWSETFARANWSALCDIEGSYVDMLLDSSTGMTELRNKAVVAGVKTIRKLLRTDRVITAFEKRNPMDLYTIKGIISGMFYYIQCGYAAPFCSIGTPYEYMCFDVREERGKAIEPTNCILIADIHK